MGGRARRIDLHVHSSESDGSFPPAELIRIAAARGLAALSIADHDSVSGIPEALRESSGSGVLFVPAVELSCDIGGRDMHVLGYFIDHTDRRLASSLRGLREARRERAERMVQLLSDAGYHLTLEEVADLSAGGSIGRAHIAQALTRRGYVESVRDAFARLIGRAAPYYVSKAATSPHEVIDLIHRSGGVSVLAHPGVTKVDDLIPGLVAAGLGGLEAYHAEHSGDDRRKYAAMASSFGLITTGGSDYHGPFSLNPAIGEVDVPEECLDRLLQAAGVPPSGM